MPSNSVKLPVLPLTQAVVLPRMSATLPMDSADVRAAVQAAMSQDGLLCGEVRTGRPVALR